MSKNNKTNIEKSDAGKIYGKIFGTNYKVYRGTNLKNRDKLNQSKWIKQKKQNGDGVYLVNENSIQPIITTGITSASLTDNTGRAREFHGYPTPYAYSYKKEILLGNKEGQKQIKSFIGESKNLINRAFCTFVHTKYLQLNDIRYSDFMKDYRSVTNLYPIISRETLIEELNYILKYLNDVRENYSLKDRSNLPLFNSMGMPIISREATEGVINILTYEFKPSTFGFLRIYSSFPLKNTFSREYNTRRKLDKIEDVKAEFIKTGEQLSIRMEELSRFVMTNPNIEQQAYEAQLVNEKTQTSETHKE